MESLTEAPTGPATNVCGDETVSLTVIETVAAAKGVDPLELEPLYDAIDPDALNAMVRSGDGSEVSFTMAGCDVVVRGAGEVVVIPPAETAKKTAVVASDER